jgi:hypothetical protein
MKIMHDKTELNLICHAKRSASILFYHTSERRKQEMAFQENVSNDHRLRDKIRIANNDSDVVEIAMKSGFTLAPMKFGSMKTAPSKGRLELVDGTPVNQYPFNTKKRLNTFNWMQARQTIRRPKLDRDKPRKNYSIINSNVRQ